MNAENAKRLFLDHYRWANPALTLVMGLSAGFITYQVPPSWKQTHPAIAAILDGFVWISPVLLIVTAVVLIVCLVAYYFLSPSIGALEAELAEEKERSEFFHQSLRDLFVGYLVQFADKLEFGAQNEDCERVTLYVHNDGNLFVPFARFSKNPQWKKNGRSQHQDDQGCIASGWQNGWYYSNAFSEDGRRWKGEQRALGMPDEIVQKLKMKSRLYAVQRISCNNGLNHGVVVLEATDPNRYAEGDIKAELEGMAQYLALVLPNVKQYIPMVETAKAKGF